MKFESIFEGWEKQSHCATDGDARCAMMYAAHRAKVSIMELPEDIYERLKSIGTWIQKNMNPPCFWGLSNPQINRLEAIIWANDTGQLDIEGFKTVEKLVCGYVPEPSPEAEEVECGK